MPAHRRRRHHAADDRPRGFPFGFPNEPALPGRGGRISLHWRQSIAGDGVTGHEAAELPEAVAPARPGGGHARPARRWKTRLRSAISSGGRAIGECLRPGRAATPGAASAGRPPTSRSITSGRRIPSGRLQKLSAMPCRSTGLASAATSSMLGAKAPAGRGHGRPASAPAPAARAGARGDMAADQVVGGGFWSCPAPGPGSPPPPSSHRHPADQRLRGLISSPAVMAGLGLRLGLLYILSRPAAWCVRRRGRDSYYAFQGRTV